MITVSLATSLLAQASGYRPFLDPLDIHDQWWFTLIPLAFLTSAAYKATRVSDFSGYWKNVIVMTIQVVLAMVAIGAIFFGIVELLVPFLGSP